MAMFFYNDSAVGNYIGILGYSTIFISLYHTLSGVLHGLGKQVAATVNYIIGMSFQLFATYFLVSRPNFGINGFFIGFIVSTVVICFLDLITLNKAIKVKIRLLDYIFKPMLATAIMIFVIFATYSYLNSMELRSYITLSVSLLGGCIAYFLTLILIKGLPPSIIKKPF